MCCPTEHTGLILAGKTTPEAQAYSHEMEVCLVLEKVENPKYFSHFPWHVSEQASLNNNMDYLHKQGMKEKKRKPIRY